MALAQPVSNPGTNGSNMRYSLVGLQSIGNGQNLTEVGTVGVGSSNAPVGPFVLL